MIYVFHGEDAFSASEALTPLLDAVGPEDLRDSNVSYLDASGFSVDQFAAAAMVMPFLAERRVVVVRGLLGAAEGQGTRRRGRRPANAKQEGPGAGLPAMLPELPPTTDVVFLDGKLNGANTLLSGIKALGSEMVKTREFMPLHRDALGSWVRERAARKGATVASSAIAKLVERVGSDLWAMDGELEKLAAYRGDEPITGDDVEALVADSREASIFDLVDAIMDKRTEAAIRALNVLMENGATGPYLISMVARQARLVAIAQELAAERVPHNEWASRLGTSSDFVVRKTAEQARRVPQEAVHGLYRLLLKADMGMKTGETSDELALTELLTEAGTLSAAPQNRR